MEIISSINSLLPDPFSLDSQDPEDKKKLVSEITEKMATWETQMTSFFGEYNESANSVRMIPKASGSKKPTGLFNSKSGETNRAVNTLATVWFRMLTAGDPYFEAISEGLNNGGWELESQDLYGVEAILSKQLEASQYKRKLLKTLRSLATFGTVVVEEPWVSKPYIEYTDFNHRSMLLTAFDPYVADMDFSDYIAFIDFPTDYRMRSLYLADPATWSKFAVEKAIAAHKDSGNTMQTGQAYARVTERKNRAGYANGAEAVNQLVTYHGKLDTSNPILKAYWDKNGMSAQGVDINATDWTVSIYGDEIVRLHHTPYGSWHHHVKIAHYNEFELEPIGYGVGKIGKKQQRELDVTQSRMNDILMFSLLSMWKVSKYAGLKANQFNIKPWNIIELEDITQLDPIRPDIEALAQGLAMQGILKEDFRTTTGATTNLQAVQTKATATEASLTQTEAIRQASVNAEIIAETLVREHLYSMHINNTDLLDKEIFVSIAGVRPEQTMRGFNRMNLPRGVGFRVKTTTDKDFRPERQKNILQMLQLATSIRNVVPEGMNVVRPLFKEYFRSIGMNPRVLEEPLPLADRMMAQMRMMQNMGGKLGNEVAGEKADEQSGYPNMEETPVGPTEVSPPGSPGVMGE